MLENSVLLMGCDRQLTRDAESDDSCLQTTLARRNGKTPNDVRSWPSYNVNSKNCKELIRFYSIIGKKNNQSSVADADRDIPARG